MAQATHTVSLNFGDNNFNCGNFHDCFNTIYNSDEDAKIMHWLSPLEPSNKHDSVRTNRFEGAGNWLLEAREFREWRGGEDGADKAVLFCSGNPGVGKTHLSSLVIDSLCDQARKEDIAVAWLYCDYNALREQTVVNIMGAILKRLVGSEIPADIREAFEEGRRPLLADLMRMLMTVITSLPPVFICIDALDELLPKNLEELLCSLKDIIQRSPRTRIFLTGRPHVREIMRNYFSEEKQEAVVVPTDSDPGDIKNYLEMRLDRDINLEAMSHDLRADIVRIILEQMSNIFLLASLSIDLILGGATIGQRRKRLKAMARGNGLSDAYTETLNRLNGQEADKRELGLKALMWVLYSERPLHVEELRHALGVEIESADLDQETVPTVRTLLSSCLGLLTIEESSSRVLLVHLTLREHLSSAPTLFDSPHPPHSIIAEVCLTYLNFRCLWDPSPTPDSAHPTLPLQEYASCYWMKHARGGMTENVRKLALGLLEKQATQFGLRLLS